MTRDDIRKMLSDSYMDVYSLGKDHDKFLSRAELFAALIEELIEERIHTNSEARWYLEGVEAACEAFIALIENYAQQYHEPVWAFDLVKKIRERGGK